MAAIDTRRAWKRRALVGLVFATTIGCSTESSTAPESSPTQALELRVAGRIDAELLCPGDRRPCLAYSGAVDLDAGALVWVSGRLLEGVLHIDGQQSLPVRAQRDYSNRCAGLEVSGPPPNALLETLYEGPGQRPEGFVDAWDSDDGVLHIGVAGDPGPTERFLDSAGATDAVCLVPGFPYSDAFLERVQAAVGSAASDAGLDNWSSSRDAWAGEVTLSVPMLGEALRARLDEISSDNSDVPIEVEAAVEVLNGTVADYEDALVSIGVAQDPADQLVARCGPVVFADVPPDLDEFPPLDDDAQAALDELLTGPTGVEAGGLASAARWSIAHRSDSELVLFGQPEDAGSSGWSAVRFERRSGSWTPIGWGGCQVQIEAPGLGPATVGLDPDNPPSPEDTELSLLINEQACASGRTPEGREVVVLVTETTETVSVLALVSPVEGGAECPSNPWHPVTVELDAPLGDRQLVDGHHHPPERVAEIQE